MSRLLHILSQIPSQTGSGVFLDNVITQAANCGYEQAAILGLPLAYKDYPFFKENPIKVFPIYFETTALPFKIPGMSDVMPYESLRYSELTVSQFDAYKQAFKTTIANAIQTFQPDVILSNHLWLTTAITAEVISELPTNVGKPKLYGVCHGTDLRQMTLSPNFQPYVINTCQHLTGVFGLHLHQLAAISKYYLVEENRLHLIGNGYNAALFTLPNHEKWHRNKKIECIYVGKLAYSKGLKQLISAVSLLDANKFHLTVVGSGNGEEAETLKQMMANVPAHITYLGYLPQLELAEQFRQSDVFVLPSFYEGLPLVVIEALATGLKVVVNDLTGLHDWLGETINRSGHLFYVPMPELEGIDTCKKTAENAYIKALSTVLVTCSNSIESHPYSACTYYSTIEERSWENVFKKMETVWGSCGSNAR